MNGFVDCRFRWVVDVGAELERGRFDDHLKLLPPSEQQQVLTFLQPLDRVRALASRLMQRCCVCLALRVDWDEVVLAITKGRKPFTTNPHPCYAPNFNFNVSHEGRYVVLASDPLHLVGVDVAAPRSCRPGPAGTRPLDQYLLAFKSQFAASEWALLQSPAHDDTWREAAFQRLWSLKEAYTKARGDGLGFHPMSRAAFRFPGGDPWAGTAQLVLDGELQTGWSFQLETLPHGHCVSVALGPVSDAVDAYGVFRSTLLEKSPPVPQPGDAKPFKMLEGLDGLLRTAAARAM